MSSRISYKQAMETLKSMFPGTQEPVFRMVLESHNWHLEHSITALLSMQSSTPGSAPAPAPANTSAPSAGSGSRDRPTASGRSGGRSGGRSNRRSGRSNAPSQPTQQQLNYMAGVLPHEFLRPPSFWAKQQANGRANSSHDPVVEQDRILAQMLQDEQFLADFNRNEEAYMQAGARRGRPAQRQQRLQAMRNAHPAQSGPSQQRQQMARSAAASMTGDNSSLPPRDSSNSSDQLISNMQSDGSSGGGSAVGVDTRDRRSDSVPRKKTWRERFAGLGAAARQKLAFLARRKRGKDKAGKYQVGSLGTSSAQYQSLDTNDDEFDGNLMPVDRPPVREGWNDQGLEMTNRSTLRAQPLGSVDPFGSASVQDVAANDEIGRDDTEIARSSSGGVLLSFDEQPDRMDRKSKTKNGKKHDALIEGADLWVGGEESSDGASDNVDEDFPFLVNQ